MIGSRLKRGAVARVRHYR